MTDLEFDVMDELYFVVSFPELQRLVQLSGAQLKGVLEGLLDKNYVKCFENVSDELPHDEVDFSRNYRNYHYLASKEGLFAHNSR